jgi:hypothetical protein
VYGSLYQELGCFSGGPHIQAFTVLWYEPECQWQVVEGHRSAGCLQAAFSNCCRFSVAQHLLMFLGRFGSWHSLPQLQCSSLRSPYVALVVLLCRFVTDPHGGDASFQRIGRLLKAAKKDRGL